MNLTGASVDHIVDGDPEVAALIRDGWSWIGVGAGEVGLRCGLVEPAGWSGAAASAFETAVAAHVAALRDVAAAMAEAVSLAGEWVAALDDARATATAALDTHQVGLDERRYWLEHRDAVEAATGAPYIDPSVETFAAAERMALAAQEELETRAISIGVRLDGLADQVVDRYPWTSDVGHALGELGGGAADGISDLWHLATALSPIRLIVDPAGVRRDARDRWDGVVATVELATDDPEALFDRFYDGFVDGIVVNRWRAGGRFALELAGLALGGAGAVALTSARAARLLRWIDSLPELDRRAILEWSRRWLVDLEAVDPQSHFVARHGPQVSLEQLHDRANHGLLPDGRQSYRTDSSRFVDWETMQDVIEAGLRTFRHSRDLEFDLTFEDVVGEGYMKNGDSLVVTSVVRFKFGDDGTLISAFPDLRKIIS